MTATQHVQDHVVHFYHLHALDLGGHRYGAQGGSEKGRGTCSVVLLLRQEYGGALYRRAEEVKQFADTGLGIFANGYWGHPAYKLPPEVNLIAVAHYLDALQWQKEIVKIHAVFAARIRTRITWWAEFRAQSIWMKWQRSIPRRLNLVGQLISQADEFVNQVYVPDLLTVASFYKDWAKWGGGLKNYLSYGEYPTQGYNKPEAFRYPRGAILNRDLSHVYPVNAKDSQEIKESIASSWYTYEGGDAVSLHPWKARRRSSTRPEASFRDAGGHDKYSFLKTPRWKDNSMEVGPLARLLVAYASGHNDVKELVGQTLAKLGVPVDALFSTLGRTAARGLSAALEVGYLKEFYSELMERVKTRETSTFNNERWDPKTWPSEAKALALLRLRAFASSLDQDQEWQDRQLPTGGSDHLEWFAARREEAALFV